MIFGYSLPLVNTLIAVTMVFLACVLFGVAGLTGQLDYMTNSQSDPVAASDEHSDVGMSLILFHRKIVDCTEFVSSAGNLASQTSDQMRQLRGSYGASWYRDPGVAHVVEEQSEEIANAQKGRMQMLMRGAQRVCEGLEQQAIIISESANTSDLKDALLQCSKAAGGGLKMASSYFGDGYSGPSWPEIRDDVAQCPTAVQNAAAAANIPLVDPLAGEFESQ